MASVALSCLALVPSRLQAVLLIGVCLYYHCRLSGRYCTCWDSVFLCPLQRALRVSLLPRPQQPLLSHPTAVSDATVRVGYFLSKFKFLFDHFQHLGSTPHNSSRRRRVWIYSIIPQRDPERLQSSWDASLKPNESKGLCSPVSRGWTVRPLSIMRYTQSTPSTCSLQL